MQSYKAGRLLGFQFLSGLSLWLAFMVLHQHDASGVIVQMC